MGLLFGGMDSGYFWRGSFWRYGLGVFSEGFLLEGFFLEVRAGLLFGAPSYLDLGAAQIKKYDNHSYSKVS
jgi:hypothetical protein